MRLLVICSQYPPLDSPESLHVQMLCTRLAANGIEVHLLTSVLPFGAPAPVGFKLYPVMRSWSWGSIYTVLKVVREVRPDAVFLIFLGWIYQFRPMVSFLPGILRRFFPSIRVVTQFENVGGVRYPALKHRIVGWLFRMLSAKSGKATLEYGTLLSASHAVIALSEIHLTEILRSCPSAQERSHVIPVPPLLEIRKGDEPTARLDGRRMLGLPDNEDTLVIAYFGYIYPGKGVETLIPAMARLKSLCAGSSRQAKLILIGTISEEHLKQPLFDLTESLGLTASDIVWLGHRNGLDASTLLHASDLAVLPFDAGVRLNNSSFAACAIHGLPIVTTKGTEMESTFVDRENVLFAVPKDSLSLAAALHTLVTNQDLRTRLRKGSFALANDCFSWDKTIRRTANILGDSVPGR